MRYPFFPLLQATLLLIFVTIVENAHAQDSLPISRSSIYEIILNLRNGKKSEGYLKDITDSTVVYAVKKATVGSPSVASDITVGYADIELMRLRRKGSVGRGALIGLGLGAAVGAVAGYASGDDPPGWFSFSAGEKAGALAFSLAIPGAAIGAGIGSNRSKYPIHGTRERFAAMRQAVQEKFKSK